MSASLDIVKDGERWLITPENVRRVWLGPIVLARTIQALTLNKEAYCTLPDPVPEGQLDFAAAALTQGDET